MDDLAPPSLPAQWRARADSLERYAPAAAEAFRQAASEAETQSAAYWTEALDVHRSSVESGYHVDSIRRFLKEGSIINYGTIDEPRIRRCDLPCKPGHPRFVLSGAAPSAGSVESIASARRQRAASASRAVRAAVGK